MASSRLQAPGFLAQESKIITTCIYSQSVTVSHNLEKNASKSFWPATAPAVLPPSEREKSSYRKTNGRLSEVDGIWWWQLLGSKSQSTAKISAESSDLFWSVLICSDKPQIVAIRQYFDSMRWAKLAGWLTSAVKGAVLFASCLGIPKHLCNLCIIYSYLFRFVWKQLGLDLCKQARVFVRHRSWQSFYRVGCQKRYWRELKGHHLWLSFLFIFMSAVWRGRYKRATKQGKTQSQRPGLAAYKYVAWTFATFLGEDLSRFGSAWHSCI